LTIDNLELTIKAQVL